jgi:hypothetical protein
MTIISTLVWQHVSAKYSHHQANTESKFRYIKCTPNTFYVSEFWFCIGLMMAVLSRNILPH